MSNNKLLILIDQMSSGGAGRVTSTLLPGLVAKGYDITLALDNYNEKVFYSIPDEVKQISIPIKGRDTAGLKQVRLIFEARKIIRRERPDAIIAVTFFPFFYAYFSALGTGIPVIAYDHTSFARRMGSFTNFIRFHLYGMADKLVILTEKDRNLLGKKFPNKEVVHNPLTYPIARNNNIRCKVVLCAGRIDSWDVKGFDRIITIWSHLAPRFPDWRLQIAGGGCEAKVSELKGLALQSGVGSQIDFLGQISDMPSLYSNASIFALPSRIEGFPMVLIEAMSQGCVCCAFEMGGAVREMMNGNSGSIVADGNIQQFETELEMLMKKYPNYQELQENGYNDAGRFTTETFYNQWDEIIHSVITL